MNVRKIEVSDFSLLSADDERIVKTFLADSLKNGIKYYNANEAILFSPNSSPSDVSEIIEIRFKHEIVMHYFDPTAAAPEDDEVLEKVSKGCRERSLAGIPTGDGYSLLINDDTGEQVIEYAVFTKPFRIVDIDLSQPIDAAVADIHECCLQACVRDKQYTIDDDVISVVDKDVFYSIAYSGGSLVYDERDKKWIDNFYFHIDFTADLDPEDNELVKAFLLQCRRDDVDVIMQEKDYSFFYNSKHYFMSFADSLFYFPSKNAWYDEEEARYAIAYIKNRGHLSEDEQGTYGVILSVTDVVASNHHESQLKVKPSKPRVVKWMEFKGDLAERTHRLNAAQSEAKILQTVKYTHAKNIAVLYEGQLPIGAAIVMKKIKGMCLYTLLQQDKESLAAGFGPLLNDQQRTRICKNIAYELRRLHEIYNLIHVDIKPENILIDTSTLQVRLIDFGFSRLKPTRSFYGSPLYMAIETMMQKETTKKSDIYQLGVTFMEVWNNRHRGVGFASAKAYIEDRINCYKNKIPENFSNLFYGIRPVKNELELIGTFTSMTEHEPDARLDANQVYQCFAAREMLFVPVQLYAVHKIADDLNKKLDQIEMDSTVNELGMQVKLAILSALNQINTQEEFEHFIDTLNIKTFKKLVAKNRIRSKQDLIRFVTMALDNNQFYVKDLRRKLQLAKKGVAIPDLARTDGALLDQYNNLGNKIRKLSKQRMKYDLTFDGLMKFNRRYERDVEDLQCRNLLSSRQICVAQKAAEELNAVLHEIATSPSSESSIDRMKVAILTALNKIKTQKQFEHFITVMQITAYKAMYDNEEINTKEDLLAIVNTTFTQLSAIKNRADRLNEEVQSWIDCLSPQYHGHEATYLEKFKQLADGLRQLELCNGGNYLTVDSLTESCKDYDSRLDALSDEYAACCECLQLLPLMKRNVDLLLGLINSEIAILIESDDPLIKENALEISHWVSNLNNQMAVYKHKNASRQTYAGIIDIESQLIGINAMLKRRIELLAPSKKQELYLTVNFYFDILRSLQREYDPGNDEFVCRKNLCRAALEYYLKTTLTLKTLANSDRAASKDRQNDVAELANIIRTSSNVDELTNRIKIKVSGFKHAFFGSILATSIKAAIERPIPATNPEKRN